MSEYQDRFVVFMDVLGFAELVRKSASCDDTRILLLNIMHEDIEEEMDRKVWQKEPYGVQTDNVEVSTAIFSDSIIASAPACSEGFWRLIFYIHSMFTKFALRGVLCRGGVSRGLFYQEDNVAFGPALLEAYNLESQIASVPRILVSRSAMNSAAEYAKEDEWSSSCLVSWIRRDEDGPAYIDQFADFKKLLVLGDVDRNDMCRLKAEEIRKSIEQQLFANVDSPKIFSKYRWIANQYNDMVSRCKTLENDLTFIDTYDIIDKNVTIKNHLNFS